MTAPTHWHLHEEDCAGCGKKVDRHDAKYYLVLCGCDVSTDIHYIQCSMHTHCFNCAKKLAKLLDVSLDCILQLFEAIR